MAIIATSERGSKRTPMESGMYMARCVQQIQIGTVTEEINGELKTLHKVRLGFEFPTELKAFKEENGEQPYFLAKDYTLSMHEKATLRQHLETWRGKKFSEDEAKSFDVTRLISVPCMINVIHKVSKKGDTFAEIGSISPLVKGMVCPDQINPTQVLSYDNFNWELFESLPSFIKEKMKTSVEFGSLLSQNNKEISSENKSEVDSTEPPF